MAQILGMTLFWGYFLTYSGILATALNDSTNPTVYQQFAVNTECKLASMAGKRILERGGNALDASITAALVIGVVNSFSSGIGGGGFLLIRKKTDQGDHFDSFDFREVSPQRIDPEMFKKNPIQAKTSGLSVGIPGEISGFYMAHKEYGRLPWKELFADPIHIAKNLKVSAILEKKLKKNSSYIFADPGLKQTFTRNGKLVVKGDDIERKNLSITLGKIAQDPNTFYTGDLAKQIVNFVNSKGGVFMLDDLENYRAKKRSVLKEKFYDFDVYTTNLPTSGLFIIEALKLLDRINIRDLFLISSQENSFYFYHILIEVLKLVMADRGMLGDPEFLEDWQKKVSLIISDIKVSHMFRKFKLDRVLPLEEYNESLLFKEDHGTTHLNVIDSDEMIVLLTSTVNMDFGSKMLDPVSGMVFNNHIDDFYIPGVDNAYHLGKMEANILEGGKRPFSSAAPTILMKDREIIAIGAAGGTRIPSAIITTISYFMAGNTLEKSVSLCRIHNQLFPLTTHIEPTLPDSVAEKLIEMGHDIKLFPGTEISSVQAIRLIDEDGKRTIEAISDLRKDGASDGR